MIRATTRIRPAGFVSLVIVFSLVALTWLCQVSPPDPTWIAGLYDDADHDDVVLAVIGTVAVPPTEPPQVRAPVHASTPLSVRGGERLGWRGLIARLDRAPPLV